LGVQSVKSEVGRLVRSLLCATPMPSENILIVEDDEAIRDIMQFILESAGFSVRTARHGREAFQILDSMEVAPSLIFLDLMMPVMNGWEFLHVREQSPRIAEVPVVVLSASGQNPPPGAQACYAKPIDLGTLLDIAQEYCEIDQAAAEELALLSPAAVAS
jgi:two-component system, chemotaxis family, chemotaxis protein CheY